LLGQFAQNGEGAVSANPDQGIQAKLAIAFYDLRGSIEVRPTRHGKMKRIPLIGGSQHCSAHAQDITGENA
jgi:hypothetical protein